MARFEITLDEYQKWHRMGRKLTWRACLAWAIAMAALVVSLYFGQYAFAVLWGAILSFIYYSMSRLAPRMRAWQLRKPFAFGPFEVELGADSYLVRLGASELRLHLKELSYAHDFGDHYRLDHASGNHLCIPKRALNAEEIQMMESYRKRFPGLPENKPWGLFSDKSDKLRP
jgi:hypothetical protein